MPNYWRVSHREGVTGPLQSFDFQTEADAYRHAATLAYRLAPIAIQPSIIFDTPDVAEYRRLIASCEKRHDDREANFAAVYVYNDGVKNNKMRIRVKQGWRLPRR